MLRAGNTAEQAVTGVGGAHAARALVAVQRQGIRGEVFAPKSLFETLLQRLCLLEQPLGPVGASEHGSDLGCPAAGRVNVALHFTQGDRALRQAAVGMRY